MNEKKEKTVGILGGMGPEATVDLMQRIIRLTPALDDIDHIRCMVDSNPKVPSRIKAIIEGNGEDPGPYMADMAKGLESGGADFLAIACNTAHYYYEQVHQAVDIPVLHMIDCVLHYVQKNHSTVSRVGLLASPAIRITKLYEEKFSPANIILVYPDDEYQDLLFGVIKNVKANRLESENAAAYFRVCRHLEEKGIGQAIVACTELSTLHIMPSLRLVDAAEILAQKIVDTAKFI